MTNLNDVLLAMSNIPVDDPIAEIWGRGLQGGYKIIEYTGALPITINANGEPIIDYRIYGNTEQTDTPTPENPIIPVGCGERTENLLPFDDKNFVIYDGGSNLIVECKNGDLYMKGTTTEIISPNAKWKTNFTFELEAGTYYCNSPSPLSSGFGRYIKKYDDNSNLLGANEYTLTITENTKCYLSFYIYNKNINSKIELMLNLGSTALPYEPYGYKLPILSNSTVTNIYLGEVETTRRIYKKRLVNPVSVTKVDNGYRVTFSISSHPAPSYESGGGVCNIAKWTDNYDNVGFVVSNTSVYITQNIIDWARKEDATRWFNEHEVYVWYVLAEPETGIVNEPLMKIGDHADTVDNTQTSVQIPTFAGTTVIDYDGTTKPSQMYIKYFGRVKND